MDLSEVIKKIFENNTCYALPEHAVNQAESLKSLSRDYILTQRGLYTNCSKMQMILHFMVKM